MQSEKLRGVKLGAPGHSLALRYELELQEQERGVAPNLSRVSKCFKILDEVVPYLGAYQRVMQMIKNELHEAVYSNDWTSKPRDHSSKAGENITPLPYFVIAQRLTERKGAEHSKLKAEISSLKEQLYTCEADLEKAVSSLDTYRHDLRDREAKLHHLTVELRNHCAEKERMQEVIGHNQHSKERLCQEFDFRMFSLQNSIACLKEENTRLKVYKSAHDELQEARLLTTAPAVDVIPANSKNEMEQHIIATEKLRFQLFTLQNSLIDDLDSWLQSCCSNKSQILPEEVIHKKKTFKCEVSAISTELSLLGQHERAISGRLEQLGHVPSGSDHSALVLPLHPFNPLIPQEQISSKYGAMVRQSLPQLVASSESRIALSKMYTSSDGGKNFYPLKIAQHCSSCAQETVLCPHKVCKDDLVIQLPVNSSHLKMSRPLFQLVKPGSQHIQNVPMRVALNTSTNTGLHITVPDFRYLWFQFNKRFPDFELAVPRSISQDQLLDLVEQLYATILLQDDNATLATDDDDRPFTLPESLFAFMCRHYIVKSLAPISCHAFISSLEEFWSQDKELLILSHGLCGDLDGSSFRYLLLQGSLVQAVTWTSHSQFSVFSGNLYPFLEEEDLEQLGLSYIAHSDNRVSAQLVLEFLQSMLLAHKDPLVVMLERQLGEQPCRVQGHMLEAEFAEVMGRIVPASSDLLCHQLFLQSLTLFQEKNDHSRQTLPTRNLAYIAAYLHRLSVQSKLKEEMKNIRGEEEIDSTRSNGPGSNHQRMQETKTIMHTMESVRKIAKIAETLNV